MRYYLDILKSAIKNKRLNKELLLSIQIAINEISEIKDQQATIDKLVKHAEKIHLNHIALIEYVNDELTDAEHEALFEDIKEIRDLINSVTEKK